MQRVVRVAGPAVLLATALIALVISLAIGGGADAPALVDPGALVRYGLPVAALFVNISVGVTIGSLVLVLFALSPDRPEFGKALDVAAGGAAVWAVSSAASAYFSFASVSNRLPGLDPNDGEALGRFVTQVSIGQAWLAMTLVGAAITVLCFAVRNQTALLFVLALAAAGLVRWANEGHSGDSSTHDQASTAIFLHVGFAGLWLGGLLTILLLRNSFEKEDRGRLGIVLARYSTLALICFLVVAASGYLSAALRLGALPALLTPYGVLVLVKIAALLALGLFGVYHRRAMVARVIRDGGRRWFWILVLAELGFMGIASGVAAALARTATPVADVGTGDLADPTPAEVLTDRPLPPELTPTRWITEWNVDLLWLLVCGFGIFFYWAGVWRLHRRGDKWPLQRPILWTIGMVLLFWVTNGSINVYEQYLFSAHMMGHMLLSMTIPLFLVLSAPVTLAARAITKRKDGSRGPREWILLAVHSKVADVLTNPLVAGVLFASSLWVFYYSPLFRWSTEEHLGHVWMVSHFLIVGYLFVQTLIGIDPVKSRPSYPLRLLLLLATMALHAFFGLSLMTGEGLLLADWYGAMGRTWGQTPLLDQQAAGGIAWSVGELPTLALAILVAVQWYSSDSRDAKRQDRKADRDGDADLEAYNEMLAERAREK